MVHGTWYTKAVRQAQKPSKASRTAKQQEGRHRGQQLDRMTASIPGTKASNQTHKPDKLTKKTIHQSTSNTQKAKNIKPPIVPRGTMTNTKKLSTAKNLNREFIIVNREFIIVR